MIKVMAVMLMMLSFVQQKEDNDLPKGPKRILVVQKSYFAKQHLGFDSDITEIYEDGTWKTSIYLTQDDKKEIANGQLSRSQLLILLDAANRVFPDLQENTEPGSRFIKVATKLGTNTFLVDYADLDEFVEKNTGKDGVIHPPVRLLVLIEEFTKGKGHVKQNSAIE